MRLIQDIKKQQVGIRMPTYLLNDVDELSKKYQVNRSEILIEATRSYIESIKEEEIYGRLDRAMSEVRDMMDGKIPSISARDTIKELKDEI